MVAARQLTRKMISLCEKKCPEQAPGIFFVDESMAMAALTSRAVPLRIEAFRP